jgi:hypothetical protein
MGFMLWRSLEYFDRAIWVPVCGTAFIVYFWPSLTWWGVTVSTVGGFIAWGIAGLGSAGAFAPQTPGAGNRQASVGEQMERPGQ